MFIQPHVTSKSIKKSSNLVVIQDNLHPSREDVKIRKLQPKTDVSYIKPNLLKPTAGMQHHGSLASNIPPSTN